MIYLDHAATTLLQPEVAEAMARVQAEVFGNPSSQHGAGRQAKAVLEDAREKILGLLGAAATGSGRDALIFTSGATEANHLGIRGQAASALSAGRLPGTIRISARDHTSSHEAAHCLLKDRFRKVDVPLTPAGIPDWSATTPPSGGDQCDIFSTTLVCSQTGIVDVSSAVEGGFPGGFIHADATQAVSLLDFAFSTLGAATCTVSAHKFGGPRGIGALLVKRGKGLLPLMAGSQEAGLRGGTECVSLAAGFATALEIAVHRRREEATRIRLLRDTFEAKIAAMARESGYSVSIIGRNENRAPHISTIGFAGVDRQAIVMAADLAGVACSTGSACSSGSSEPAPALAAMGLPEQVARGAVRFSFGHSNTPQEIVACVHHLEKIFRGFVERGIVRAMNGHIGSEGQDR